MDLDLGDTRAIIATGEKFGLLRNQLAYCLATARWETAETMKPVREAFWLSEEWRLENLSYAPYYGRGYVQLTHRENYERVDDHYSLGGELVAEPDRALEPDLAAHVLCQGMRDGWFTGLELADFITLDRSDFVSARGIVNGSDHATEIAQFAIAYDEALLSEGYGVEEKPDPARPALPDPGPLAGAALLLVVAELARVVAEQRDTIEGLEGSIEALERWARSYE